MFDYDISGMDIEEEFPIARSDIHRQNDGGIHLPDVYEGETFTVRNPLRNRNDNDIRNLGKLRQGHFKPENK